MVNSIFFELSNFYGDMHGGDEKIPLEKSRYWFERAICELDRITLGRFSEVAGNYLMCICDMADCLYQEEVAGGAVQSENIDGYSVTYAEPKSPEVRHMDIAKRYLSGTGMLFCGVI